MLLQSHEGFIRLLPALPDVWPVGSVDGIVARGGFVVSLTWKDRKLATARLKSERGEPCGIYSAAPIGIADEAGRPIEAKSDGRHVYAFPTTAGHLYTVTPAP